MRVDGKNNRRKPILKKYFVSHSDGRHMLRLVVGLALIISNEHSQYKISLERGADVQL
jgi:hypothetical protein